MAYTIPPYLNSASSLSASDSALSATALTQNRQHKNSANIEKKTSLPRGAIVQADQQTLANWSKVHTEKLKQTITDNMPTMLAEFMLPEILKDNNFINNNTLKQSMSDDEIWAYNMELDLRHAITRHSASSGFNLLQVTCKQLACEIVGIDTVGDAWNKIYINILRTVPTIVLPDINTKPKSILFKENNLIYVYTVINFKKMTD